MLKEENFNNGRTEGLNNALENLVISLMETNNLSQEEAEKQARILLRMSWDKLYLEQRVARDSLRAGARKL